MSRVVYRDRYAYCGAVWQFLSQNEGRRMRLSLVRSVYFLFIGKIWGAQTAHFLYGVRELRFARPRTPPPPSDFSMWLKRSQRGSSTLKLNENMKENGVNEGGIIKGMSDKEW